MVNVTYSLSLSVSGKDVDLYAWVPDRPEYIRFKELPVDATKQELSFERGIIRRTAFGERFMLAIGLTDDPRNVSAARMQEVPDK